MSWRRAILGWAAALVMVGPAAAVKLPVRVTTPISVPGVGQVRVVADKGVTIDGARRKLVDATLKHFCAAMADHACDPKGTYEVQIGSGPGKACWSSVFGVLAPTPDSKATPVGLVADYQCLDASESLLPTRLIPYRPGDGPPVAINDCPGWCVDYHQPEAIQQVPVAITAVQ